MATPDESSHERDWSFIRDDEPRRDRTGLESWLLVAGICFAVAGLVVWGGFSQTGTSDDPPLFTGSSSGGVVLCCVGVVLVTIAAWSHFRRR